MCPGQRQPLLLPLPTDGQHPVGEGHLHAYRNTPQHAVGTMVLLGGFDSYMEELFATQAYFVAAGYDVVIFEGPGQGSVLAEAHLPMTAD